MLTALHLLEVSGSGQVRSSRQGAISPEIFTRVSKMHVYVDVGLWNWI